MSRPPVLALVIAVCLTVGIPATASATPGDQHTGAPPRVSPTATFTEVHAPGTAFSAAPKEILRKYGYVENEYYVTGKACRYRIPRALSTAEVVDCGHPFKTRMLVRRPADPAKFNGTAIVEWTNTSTGGDVDFTWAATYAHQMTEGYAEISLSAQVQGLNGLKAWNPQRYGSLSLDAPTTDPVTGGALAGDTEVLSYDALTQTVAGLRHPTGTNVLPRMQVSKVIALGESQSALRLTPYYNSIDPLYHQIDGVVAYDALGQLRGDSSTKAISVASELGIGLLPTGLPAPDTRNSRRWEVAGASHVSYQDFQYIDPMILRDGWVKGADGKPSNLTDTIVGCSQSPAWSTVPTGYVLDSAIDHVNAWARGGSPAPHAPLLTRDPGAPRLYNPTQPNGTSPGYATDAKGQTIGGIQLSQYAVPTADIEGGGTTGPGSCWLTGKHRFLSDQELSARYPDPKKYLGKVVRVTGQNLRAGFIGPRDAVSTVKDATAIARRL